MLNAINYGPIMLTQQLVRCKSVTPADDGAIPLLAQLLQDLGFSTEIIEFAEEGYESVLNLYARYGAGGRNFCFAGHTDVVPEGDESAWKFPPFAGEIEDGIIYGRGVVDMKGAIAAFVAAVAEFIQSNPSFDGSISFLITGDEEGVAINGTPKLLRHLAERGEKIDVCLIGEPTGCNCLGDIIKIGGRGSANFELHVKGVQGHVAYQNVADNPIDKLVPVLQKLTTWQIDKGTQYFQPSNLEVVYLASGTGASNVIPASALALFNIRYNDLHTHDSLHAKLNALCKDVTKDCNLVMQKNGGELFLTKPGDFTEIIQAATKEIVGVQAELSTAGATSDARFIKDYAPVIEFGLLNSTAHKVDECANVEELRQLTKIYKQILERYFESLAV